MLQHQVDAVAWLVASQLLLIWVSASIIWLLAAVVIVNVSCNVCASLSLNNLVSAVIEASAAGADLLALSFLGRRRIRQTAASHWIFQRAQQEPQGRESGAQGKTLSPGAT